MRFVFLCLLALSAVMRAHGADVEFVRVWPSWRDAASFERISEFFTGQEPVGQPLILRSHPEERTGFYFLARLKNPGAVLPDAKFSLHVIAPHDPQPKTFAFPATVRAGTHAFSLGLTGPDWADRKDPPVAWKLELLGPDGKVVATAQSFLWELPKK